MNGAYWNPFTKLEIHGGQGVDILRPLFSWLDAL